MGYIKEKFDFFKSHYPIRLIILSFLFLILLGTILLILPISSRQDTHTDFISAFFTSVSATCVTGLTVYDTWTHWSFFGQVVIFCLMQIGALSIISIMMGFILILRKKMGLRDMNFMQVYTSGNIMDIPLLVKTIISLTIVCESLGTILLMIRFIPKFGWYGIWISLFTSISSYCNAGFDLMGIEGPYLSFENYSNDPLVSITMAVLIILGGLGFIVISDLYSFIIKKYKNKEKNVHIAFHSYVSIMSTIALIIIGTLCIIIVEYNNTLEGMSFWQKLNVSFFQSCTSRSAGMVLVDVTKQNNITKIFTMIMMFIGSSPCSTGGGIKTTTLVVLLFAIISTLAGKKEIIIHKHRIDKELVYRALTVTILSFMLIMITFFFISLIETNSAVLTTNILFEIISAFATGISVGVTQELSTLSKLVLSIIMFAGRVGPFSLIISLYIRNKNKKINVISPEASIIIG